MSLRERDIYIWLNNLGFTNRSIDRLEEYFGDVNTLWDASKSQLEGLENENFNRKMLDKIVKFRDKVYIDRLMENLETNKIDVITILDDNYPRALNYIYDRPKVLYKKGKDMDEDKVYLALVGSRKATSYGKWACEKFVKELVDLGVVIVSGLASGIDTIAHKKALDENGYTVGVLGNGIDQVYPKRNLSLYKEMEEKGSIITEFPLGTLPLAYNFPQRNRIISGLSAGVIVIEAQEKSGSLITAHHGLDQGKDVFALPGNINSLFSGGTNRLIKDGAKPLLSIEDIIEEIYELQNIIREEKIKKIDISCLSDTEMDIVRLLEEGPFHSDLIAYRTGKDMATISSTLTILELKGIIKEIQGNVFTIN